MREAICDAFFKDFKECKKKMAQLFHLPDLHDIIPNGSEGNAGKADSLAKAALVEPTKPEVGLALPQVSQAAATATTLARWSLVREAIEQTMAEVAAMIEAAMEAIKFGGIPASTSRS